MPRQACPLMAGPAPQGVDSSGSHEVDYKDWRALKSCRSEFRHNPLMWISQPVKAFAFTGFLIERVP